MDIIDANSHRLNTLPRLHTSMSHIVKFESIEKLVKMFELIMDTEQNYQKKDRGFGICKNWTFYQNFKNWQSGLIGNNWWQHAVWFHGCLFFC